jgi:hypothetical protein
MATTLYLRNTASSLGGAGQKAMSTTRGTASTTAVTNTTASGTNIPVTLTAGGTAATWWFQVGTGSVTGNLTANIRGLVSNTSANAGVAITVDLYGADGTTLIGNLKTSNIPATATAFTATDSAKALASTAVTTQAAYNGCWIKVTLRIINVGTMGASQTASISYDGPTASAAGDSYLTFATTLPTFDPTYGSASMIAQYPMLEGSGTTVHDTSGNGYDLTVTSGVLQAGGGIIPTSTSPTARSMGTGTMSAWTAMVMVHTPSSWSSTNYMNVWDSFGSGNWTFKDITNASPFVQNFYSVGGGGYVNGVSSLATNTDLLLAYVYDGTNVKVFVNGVQVATSAGTASLSRADTFYLGSGVSSTPNPDDPFPGTIKWARFFNAALLQGDQTYWKNNAPAAWNPAPVVQSSGTGGSNFPVSVTVPSGVATGDLILLAIKGESAGNVVGGANTFASTGFTYLDTIEIYAGYTERMVVFYKYATGADTGTYTITDSGAFYDAAGIAVRITGGPTSGTPNVDTIQKLAQSSPNVTIPSFTPTANGSLLVGFAADDDNGLTITPPAAMTHIANVTYGSTMSADSLTQSTAAATGNLTWTNGYLAMVLTFRTPTGGSYNVSSTPTWTFGTSVAGVKGLVGSTSPSWTFGTATTAVVGKAGGTTPSWSFGVSASAAVSTAIAATAPFAWGTSVSATTGKVGQTAVTWTFGTVATVGMDADVAATAPFAFNTAVSALLTSALSASPVWTWGTTAGASVAATGAVTETWTFHTGVSAVRAATTGADETFLFSVTVAAVVTAHGAVAAAPAFGFIATVDALVADSAGTNPVWGFSTLASAVTGIAPVHTAPVWSWATTVTLDAAEVVGTSVTWAFGVMVTAHVSGGPSPSLPSDITLTGYSQQWNLSGSAPALTLRGWK